jgi:oligoribonuclease
MAEQKLIWIDLEMSGLNEDDHILEIATLITDTQLTVLDEGPNLVIKTPDTVLESMNEWCQKTHQETGLIQRVKQSQLTLKDAEQATLHFVRQYCQPGVSPMCGNTVSQDRIFLKKYMPELESFFHYRHLDVTTIKILAQLWTQLPEMKKSNEHQALSDIKASVEELKYYRQHWHQFVTA